MRSGWDYSANAAAVDFMVGCKPADRRRIITVLDRLVDNPAIKADAFFREESGRKISIVRLSGFRIAFWVDHFAKEVRVVDVDFG